MTRAAREPSEDVVRRLSEACEAAGLVVSARFNRLSEARDKRIIAVFASCKGWPHESPMLQVMTVMDLAGSVGEVQIACHATNEDPFMQVWIAPKVRDAMVGLEELPIALRVILRERDAVIAMVAEGQQAPFKGTHWRWEPPEGLSGYLKHDTPEP